MKIVKTIREKIYFCRVFKNLFLTLEMLEFQFCVWK